MRKELKQVKEQVNRDSFGECIQSHGTARWEFPCVFDEWQGNQRDCPRVGEGERSRR